MRVGEGSFGVGGGSNLHWQPEVTQTWAAEYMLSSCHGRASRDDPHYGVVRIGQLQLVISSLC
jgi:hypothetical protein